MARTSGGLMKLSVQLTREEYAWCRAEADAQGKCGISAVIRKSLDASMAAAEQAAEAKAS